MTPIAAQVRRFVRRALVDATGTLEPNRAQLATAFETLCEQLRARLQPLFGAGAVEALFGRSLHLATAEFPFLATLIPAHATRCSFDGLKTSDPEIEPEQLQAGLAAVLAQEIALLATFIGEDFVLSLVQQAWGTATRARNLTRPEDDDYE